MGEFYKLTESKLDRAVDNAIKEENRRYLESPEGKDALSKHAANVREWTSFVIAHQGTGEVVYEGDRMACEEALMEIDPDESGGYEVRPR